MHSFFIHSLIPSIWARFRHAALLSGLVLLLLAGCTPFSASTSEQTVADGPNAKAANARLGRGVNLGNALEAPIEGEWGLTIEDEYFSLIQAAGFDSVRIPIRWSGHAAEAAPYTIDEPFFQRVDRLLDLASEHNLAAVINIHHYEEMMVDPDGDTARFLALWQQISERYQERPDTVYFEILNEPQRNLTSRIWNQLLAEALGVIRESNPTRTVIVGPTGWNSIDDLRLLQIPPNDPNLIVTFHYYSPFEFTHQGAEWTDGADAWLGTQWPESDSDLDSIRRDFDKALTWSQANNVPLYMGEFGAYSRADMASRERWTEAVVAEAMAREFSFAYWEFGAGFGVYDREASDWNPELLSALLQE